MLAKKELVVAKAELAGLLAQRDDVLARIPAAEEFVAIKQDEVTAAQVVAAAARTLGVAANAARLLGQLRSLLHATLGVDSPPAAEGDSAAGVQMHAEHDGLDPQGGTPKRPKTEDPALDPLRRALEAAEADDADSKAEDLQEGCRSDQDGRAGATKASGRAKAKAKAKSAAAAKNKAMIVDDQQV